MPIYYKNCEQCGKVFKRNKEPKRPEPRFCSTKCVGDSMRLPFRIKNGYKLVHRPDHVRADARGMVREHLLVMEEKIGRPVKRHESVHHIDGDKLNNSPDNLLLFASHTEHLEYHWRVEGRLGSRNEVRRACD